MNEQRLIDLEAKLSHQDVLLNQMSDVLYRQQQQVDLLSGRLQRLLARVQALEADAGQSQSQPTDEPPPPHY